MFPGRTYSTGGRRRVAFAPGGGTIARTIKSKIQGGHGVAEESEKLSEAEMRERVITLAFGGDESRFREFCDVVRQAIPEDTAVVLRGSAVTGERWKDGTP